MTRDTHLDWDDLRVFLEVARKGSLSGAARGLRLDHSTVSRRIAQLEQAIGAGVFERHPLGLRLNEHGERLLQYVQAIEANVMSLGQDVKVAGSATRGTVRLAMMEGIASLYLAPRLDRFRESLPEVDLELVSSPQFVQVSRREADVFLSFFRPEGRGLVTRYLGRFGLGLFASAAYLDTRGTPYAVADLANHDFVSYIDDLIQVDAVRWLDDVIREPRVAFHSNSMIAQMSAAAAGLGIVLLPFFAVERYPDLIRVLPEQVVVQREIWLSVHRDLEAVPRIDAVMRFLADLIGGDQTYLNREA